MINVSLMLVPGSVSQYDHHENDHLHRPSRFHPDHIQDFFTKRKRKSEVWKCAVRTCLSSIFSSHVLLQYNITYPEC